MNRIAAAALLLALCTACRQEGGPLHEGGVMLSLHAMECDTLELEAPGVLQKEFCIMHEDTIMLADKHMPGIYKYTADGRFLGVFHKDGIRAWAVARDSTDGSVSVLDAMSRIWTFDRQGRLLEGSGCSVIGPDSAMTGLYRRPDPRRYEMYEYNPASERMLACGGRVFLPVITEHRKFNGYFGFNRKDYWRRAHIIEAFDADSLRERMLIGRYPEVYSRQNIPVFANYDLQLYRGAIAVSFAADSRIYAYSPESGRLLYTFGHREEDILGKYPVTSGLDEYEEAEAGRWSCGQYCRLYSDGDRLLRTLVTDKGQWKLQVYRGSVLVGDIPAPGPMDVIGHRDGIFFAFAGIDYVRERLTLVRFRLR